MQPDEQSFSITEQDIKSITDIDEVFSTTKFLPPIEQIPIEFIKGNNYTQFVKNLFHGTELSGGTITFKFDIEPEQAKRFIISHLSSFEPKHNHKIAGVGYLLFLMSDLEILPAIADD